METTKRVDIRQITQSRAVSHANQGIRERVDGLDILVRLRRRNANRSAAKRNAYEEQGLAAKFEAKHGPGSAYEAGFQTGLPKKANNLDYVKRALEAGFPSDDDAQAVKLLCEKFTEQAEAAQ